MKKKLLDECLRIALKKNTPHHHPEWGYFHHFCFIVQGNKIIEWSTNRRAKPGPHFGYRSEGKIHAETDAYRKAKGLLVSSDPFIAINIRLNRQSETKLSAPCKCCYNFLKQLGCSKIWFTTDAGWAEIKF